MPFNAYADTKVPAKSLPKIPPQRERALRVTRSVRMPPKGVPNDEGTWVVLVREVPANEELSDAAVIARSLREPSWFAEIFRRHGIEIVRYVHARLGPALAEDVAAETFLAAFRYRDRFDPARLEARPWLYGIAVRQIGKHQRAEIRYRRAMARLPVDGVPADFGDRSIDRVIAEQLRPQLSAALTSLSRQDRELLLLIAWADLTYAEAAQALGLTISAVRSRLNRIRVKARKALGGANPALGDEQALEGEETNGNG